MADRVIEELDEAESLRLISAGGIGRIAYMSRFGPAVLPVNYRWHDGAVVFRTARHSALDEDLQTGIAGGDYKVAFEIDEIDVPGRQGWSVLIQGPAHHVESAAERAAAEQSGVEPWPAGDRELFVRIVPSRVTGRRIKPARSGLPGLRLDGSPPGEMAGSRQAGRPRPYHQHPLTRRLPGLGKPRDGNLPAWPERLICEEALDGVDAGGRGADYFGAAHGDRFGHRAGTLGLLTHGSAPPARP